MWLTCWVAVFLLVKQFAEIQPCGSFSPSPSISARLRLMRYDRATAVYMKLSRS